MIPNEPKRALELHGVILESVTEEHGDQEA